MQESPDLVMISISYKLNQALILSYQDPPVGFRVNLEIVLFSANLADSQSGKKDILIIVIEEFFHSPFYGGFFRGGQFFIYSLERRFK